MTQFAFSQRARAALVMALLLAALAGCLRPSSSQGGVTVIAPLAMPTNELVTPQLTIQPLPTRALPNASAVDDGEASGDFLTPALSLGPVTLAPMTETPTPYYSPTPTATIPPTAPSPGDRCTHTIQGGDTLFALSLAYDTTVSEIMAANPALEDEGAIHPGDVLWLPNCDPSLSEAEMTATAAATATGLPSATPTLAASVAARHTVAAGDNLYRIALQYGVTMDAIIAINDLENPDALSIGQELLIPAAGE